MVSVRLDRIHKQFGSVTVLDDISLDIRSGELFFLLGPSGCGKSTLLRIIAGLMDPSLGRIFFSDRDVTALPTQRRNAVMCFQNYALWPHLTVRQNVAFGLDVRGLPAREREFRLEESLRMVQMEKLADRKPAALSGGQQQRVALARALAVRPDCLLLDEPLSNLDAKLRNDMRGEIRSICKSAGLTTIYVTHDQKEALSIADRIAVMRDGKVAQVGTGEDLYDRPSDSFVADFLGETNLLHGTVIGKDNGTAHVQTPLGILAAPIRDSGSDHVVLSIRPRRMRFVSTNSAGDRAVNRVEGKILESSFLGDSTEYWVMADTHKLKVVTAAPVTGVVVAVEWDVADTVLLAE
jgi:ABC-type Fe3+/spermidine/putrescine transport system ATPase subunit